MADDLDDLIRRSMKTLDDETPPGYFEGLPSQALARLEDGSNMDSQGTRQRDVSMPSAPAAPHLMNNDRDEDSGLHDIRNLASSTKARLSSRRSTQSPVVTEDELASSSAGWKAVALPEPAKMVSLPALAELPSAVEIERGDKAARAAAKVDAKRAKQDDVAAPVAATAVAATDAAPPTNQIGARIAAQQSGGKGKTVALVGVLVAAAAGVGIFMMMNKKDGAPAASATEGTKPTVVATAPALQQVKEVAPPPVVEPIKEEAPVPPPPPVEVAAAVPEDKAPAKADKKHKVEIRDTVNVAKEEPKVVKPAKEEPKAKGDDGEPSFDALLKEGGISDQKAATKPKLDKTSLSQPDFKAGIGAVSGRAQGCFKGTQGTAMVKMSIAPDGSVAKATVTGQFAGTPEGTCVEAAVKSAKFPAWDGGPQSFSYSYLLAE